MEPQADTEIIEVRLTHGYGRVRIDEAGKVIEADGHKSMDWFVGKIWFKAKNARMVLEWRYTGKKGLEIEIEQQTQTVLKQMRYLSQQKRKLLLLQRELQEIRDDEWRREQGHGSGA